MFGAIGTFAVLQSFAAPKGGGLPAGTTTISQPILVTDADNNKVINTYDKIRFDVKSTQTDKPYVHLQCFKSGVLVGQGTEGYFVGALDDGIFGLYSGDTVIWTASDAVDCTADVQTSTYSKNGRLQSTTILATVKFHVNAQNDPAPISN